MPKTRRMRQIEARYGRPVKKVLRDLYQTRTLKEVSAELRRAGIDVSVGTLSMWFLKLNIATRCWTLPEEQGEETTDGKALK